MKKIAVAGTGYVGLSLAVLLARHNQVTAVDILPEKIEQIQQGISPIVDKEIQEYLPQYVGRTLSATTEAEKAYKNCEILIIATPTNYDEKNHRFDTSSVESVLSLVEKVNPQATVVIKSTCSVGYLEKIKNKFAIPHLLFSPEFLREGKALYDNLHPARIVVGFCKEANLETKRRANSFARLLQDAALDVNIPILLVNSTEAEAIKLFSNTYLAMRIAFFNELDSYAMENGLETKQIIEGICLDPRIGVGYNNPSFGYGGYCLPKDSKELLANYGLIPQRLITAIVESNQVRKNFIAKKISLLPAKRIGIYRLVMKAGSDNYREAAILDLIKILKDCEKEIFIYEPTWKEETFHGNRVIKQLEDFLSESELIVANRKDSFLNGQQKGKIFSRDIYSQE